MGRDVDAVELLKLNNCCTVIESKDPFKLPKLLILLEVLTLQLDVLIVETLLMPVVIVVPGLLKPLARLVNDDRLF